MWRGWFVWSFMAVESILCIDVESGSKEIQNIFDRLYKNQHFINNIDSIGGEEDISVRKAMKQFISDSEKVGRLMHRFDAIDSLHLERLRARLLDKHLDIYCIQVDTFHVLLDIDGPYKEMIDPDMVTLEETYKNLTKLLKNSNNQPNNVIVKVAKQNIKKAILVTTSLFENLLRRRPEHLKRKLEQSLNALNNTDGISEANDIIKSIIKLAQKYYTQVDFKNYKIKAEPLIGRHRSDEEYAISFEIRQIQSNITELRFAKVFQPDYTQTVIKKCKTYFLKAAPKLFKLGQVAGIQPLSIHAKRLENLANHIRTENDIKQAYELLETAMNYDDRGDYKICLDSYIIKMKKYQKDVEVLIDLARYGELDDYSKVGEKFKGLMPAFKDALWQLAARKHVKGYSKINNNLQDILDDIRDAKEDLSNSKAARQKILQNMTKIDKAITEFFKKNNL